MRELLIDAGRRELFWLAILGGFGVLISLVIGTVAIGRPVRRLADQARAVGSGDFAARVELRQKDELALLAREMNRMAERLEGTLAELQREQDARFIALDQLRHAERLTTVGRLAAGVAHELGTPLNVVSGRSALIMGEPGVTRQIREHVEVIARQSDIMAKTIRQLLDFARRRPATKAVGDLGQLAEETLAFLNQLAAKKRLQLTSELPPNPVLVRFDPAQIQQVLTNLVVNAIHATRRGRITVTCGWREAAPPHAPEAPPRMCAFLSVADEGCGIPRELLPHIFDPFMTTKDQGEGTGLGLSVSYGIVEEHGGWIDVDTEPGAGATFTVYLPEDDRG
jgi:signal transduction histidine kinase